VKTTSCLDMAARRKALTLPGNQTPFCGLQPAVWLLYWQNWTVDVSKNERTRMFCGCKTNDIYIYKGLFGVSLQPPLTHSFTIHTNVKLKSSMPISSWGERQSDHSLRLLLLQFKKLKYFLKLGDLGPGECYTYRQIYYSRILHYVHRAYCWVLQVCQFKQSV
jgi:hypothetical protein